MILIELFLTFLKIGVVTFGGGYAMIPIIESEILHKGWLTGGELVDFLAISEGTPGPFAINVATYIGKKTAGMPGAVFTTLGVTLPSFIITLIISGIFIKIRNNKITVGVLNGLKAAVVGLIGAAVISIANSAFFPNEATPPIVSIASLIICALCTFLTFKEISPILIIGISAGCGILCYFIPGINI